MLIGKSTLGEGNMASLLAWNIRFQGLTRRFCGAARVRREAFRRSIRRKSIPSKGAPAKSEILRGTKRVERFEPWFFLFFGLFHLHRIWGLIDRKAYADFWLGILADRGFPYYLIMGVLAALSILGIVTFVENIGRNPWWRWIYLAGGCYLLFDLFAIAADLAFWRALIQKMFDVSAPYWTALWLVFIGMGGASFVLGLWLLKKRR